MVFYDIDWKSKDANKSRLKAYMIKDRPGAIGFTSGFSQDSINITVGEKITVEQLIEKRIIMRLSRHDHVYRQVDRLLPASTTITPHIDRYPACI